MTSVAQLGYLGFEVGDLAAWEAFSTGVLGLGVVDRLPGGGFSLRMDGYRQRFFISPGPAEDLAAIGWQVEDEGQLDQLCHRLRASGIPIEDAGPEAAAARHVARLVRFRDPAGIPSELFIGPELAGEPFRSETVRAGF